MGNIITVPFAALLRWIYGFTASWGWSIILFAAVIKLILLPFQMKSKRGMIRMGRLSGKQQELQKQYAKNREKLNEEVAKLYQEAGVNPMSGCLWSLLPLFIMLPLYSIIYRPITHFMGLTEEVMGQVREMAVGMGFVGGGAYEQIHLSDFIHKNWSTFQASGIEGLVDVDFMFLGMDLSAVPTSMFGEFAFTWGVIGVILIPIIAAVTQYLSSVLMMKSNGQASNSQSKMMNLMMPLMTIWFCFSMPAAMGVYWIINSVLMTVQEVLLGKFYTKKLNAEEDEREAKREAARQLRMEEAKRRAAEMRENEEKRPKKQPQQKTGEKKVSTNEAGRIGERPYARGRSYQEDRYENKE